GFDNRDDLLPQAPGAQPDRCPLLAAACFRGRAQCRAGRVRTLAPSPARLVATVAGEPGRTATGAGALRTRPRRSRQPGGAADDRRRHDRRYPERGGAGPDPHGLYRSRARDRRARAARHVRQRDLSDRSGRTNCVAGARRPYGRGPRPLDRRARTGPL
ncbi:MAG: hypothetical protein AVDCRST_MAG88-623, partial [uncultured Thermomicrobiales bacterium]